jgi:ribonuclease III
VQARFLFALYRIKAKEARAGPRQVAGLDMKTRALSPLETELGHRFRRLELLEQALTHSSHAREMEAKSATNGNFEKFTDNEQLEFLGDAVLGFVTSQELFERFPHFQEGELSKMRAHLVSAKHLIRTAKELDLGRYLRLGRGEEKSGGREKNALLTDALEAVLAALYLEAGLEPTREFILKRIVLPEVRRLKKQSTDGMPITDYKSALQEVVHTSGLPQPIYVLVKEKGPEHSKTFTIEARVHSRAENSKLEHVGRAEGSTKKKAEQAAAKQVLECLWSVQKQESDSPPKKTRASAKK